MIPKNFSDNLVSMLDGNYHQPKLTYYVNEKKSAIAPKVTDTGANTIEEQINSEFVSTVGETVAGIAKDAGVDFKGQGNPDPGLAGKFGVRGIRHLWARCAIRLAI